MSAPVPDPGDADHRFELNDRLDRIRASDWNRLLGDGPAFMRHEFLTALEASGCVSPATGWEPCHAALYRGDELIAAMPLYDKHHSWGEFVFDWAWASAYERAGLDYYPKRLSASPFTPATGPRLLGDAEARAELLARVLADTTARHRSSLHIQFADAAGLATCDAAGLTLRKDCQFHWHNRGYASFDDFLGELSSKKRKKIRRERRRIHEQGVTFRHVSGEDLSEGQWERAWSLTRTTFLARGSEPYLSLEFFVEASRRLPGTLQVIFAQYEREPIAAAICYATAGTLYGRYWGALARFHSLHFETCYYQGIEHCIERGLSTFEPGTQGEHKIARGFVPATTWSAHWLADSRFASAIEDYLEREGDQVDRYIDAVHDHSPYRASGQ